MGCSRCLWLVLGCGGLDGGEEVGDALHVVEMGDVSEWGDGGGCVALSAAADHVEHGLDFACGSGDGGGCGCGDG